MNKQDTSPQKSVLIAHEIRQPLSAISMLAGLGRDELKEPVTAERDEILRKYLEEIITQTGRCSQIIEEIRQSKPVNGNATGATDLNHIIKEELDIMSYTFKGNDITVRTQLQDNLPRIQANRQTLHQLFSNLFGNAVAAIRKCPAKMLIVRTSQSANNLLVEVRDTGNGIDAGDLDRIFEPYHTTKGESNMGLGLAVCKRIVENHNGTIRAAENIENGTCIQVCLPVKQS